GARATVDQVEAGRDAVYATIFDNVTGSAHAFKPDGAGSWSDTRLDLPAGGSTGIASANSFGPESYFTYQGVLTPTTLYAGRGDAMPMAIKALPARFDPSPYRQSQYEAISKDGTRIPYFVVRPRNAQGATPMVLYGYGGFEASQSPFYWTAM